MDNYFEMKLSACSGNEAFARSCVAAFCVSLNPSLEEINDIKTAVSEAVTNAVVHGYNSKGGEITLSVAITDKKVRITIADKGVGIKDVHAAMQPFYTTRPEQERSGMGFTIMQSFMDEVTVDGENGTVVTLEKNIYGGADA